ncbi:MAG: adenylate/guanylate cyclase domain-containing protein [Marmoricola sp.]
MTRRPGPPRYAKIWWLRALISVSILVINLGGTVVVFFLAALVVPLPHTHEGNQLKIANLILAASYMVLAMVVGTLLGLRISDGALRWIRTGREATDRERRNLLKVPRHLFLVVMSLWTIAAFLFGAYNTSIKLSLGGLVFVIVLMSGLSTSAVTYLVAERLQRPFARIALAQGVPDRVGMRLGLRTVLAWFLGTGVALLGITLAGITALSLGKQITAERLAITMVVLGGGAFVFGGFTTWLAAKAGSDPVRALRTSVNAAQAGDFSVDVPIYDGTELGILQAGFNDMLHGLREREKMRDLFGRHDGAEGARAALASGVKRGGEVRHVGILFVDIIGSTGMASNRPPEEVVTVLNRFFDVVIEVVNKHGGWVNKFEGDAALAVWGAPTAQPGMEESLLAAARELGERLRHEIPEVRAGIGVSAGNAVAGNVGAAQRYEYTVIGDPVNEAARLTELAKEVPTLVMANATLLDAAGEESEHWHRLTPVVVRGRSEPTPIATPAAT